MLELGSRDVGFAGADWVEEMRADVVELLDTELDPVQVVAAAPRVLLDSNELPARRLVVASEYERLTRDWIGSRGLDAEFVRSYGATEVFPPEDADVIVDNTATGSTLRANDLVVVDTLVSSSTRLYASPAAMADPGKKIRIEDLRLLLEERPRCEKASHDRGERPGRPPRRGGCAPPLHAGGHRGPPLREQWIRGQGSGPERPPARGSSRP